MPLREWTLDGVLIPDGVPPAVVFRRVLGDSKPDATGIRLTGDVSREFTAEL